MNLLFINNKDIVSLVHIWATASQKVDSGSDVPIQFYSISTNKACSL